MLEFFSQHNNYCGPFAGHRFSDGFDGGRGDVNYHIENFYFFDGLKIGGRWSNRKKAGYLINGYHLEDFIKGSGDKKIGKKISCLIHGY